MSARKEQPKDPKVMSNPVLRATDVLTWLAYTRRHLTGLTTNVLVGSIRRIAPLLARQLVYQNAGLKFVNKDRYSLLQGVEEMNKLTKVLSQ
ncbi:hypothetical protein PM082_022224 [Marasmius tenuissimus]|nr:hypothetical protein PM082_022224 [Marasmius tenuissimus]